MHLNKIAYCIKRFLDKNGYCIKRFFIIDSYFVISQIIMLAKTPVVNPRILISVLRRFLN